MITDQINNLFINLHFPVWTGTPENSLLYSLPTPYSISRNNFGLKLKKAPKQFVLKLFKWAQMDLNHRPSDYETEGLYVFCI